MSCLWQAKKYKSNKLKRVHSETHQDDSAEKKADKNKNKKCGTHKVHSFLKQSFTRSSIDIIWWYLQLRLAWKSAVGTTKLCQLKIMHNTVLKTNAQLKSPPKKKMIQQKKISRKKKGKKSFDDKSWKHHQNKLSYTKNPYGLVYSWCTLHISQKLFEGPELEILTWNQTDGATICAYLRKGGEFWMINEWNEMEVGGFEPGWESRMLTTTP